MNVVNIPQAKTFASSSPTISVDRLIPGVKLGQTVNLVDGYRTGWDPNDPATAPFAAPTMVALPVQDATIAVSADSPWQLPRITLHADAVSLLSTVFPYTVLGVSGDDTVFALPSGPLLVGDGDAAKQLAALSAYLGVDLTTGSSYMLVELIRTAGTASAHYVAGGGGNDAGQLLPEALSLVAALPGVDTALHPTIRLDAADARPFVDSFASLGTHYVSSVTAGDRIFQVFAYEATAFAQLKAAFDKAAAGKGYVDGLEAMAFQYYTTPRNSETGPTFGYVRQFGTIAIVSRDPAFAASIAAGNWQDKVRAGGNSIFMAFGQPHPAVDLSTFTRIAPIALELSPIGNLIPVNVSAAGRNYWNRLFKGAMLQKHGDAVDVRFTGARDHDWPGLLPNSGGWLSTIATPSVDVYDAHVALSDVKLTNRAVVKRFACWTIVMEAGGGTVAIPGDDVSLTAFLIDAAGDYPPPTLTLASKAAFDGITLACGRMNGAIGIAVDGGDERMTVVDGVVLGSTAAGADGRTGIAVTGDLFGVQNAAQLDPQVDNLNLAIVTCQTLLYTRGARADDAKALARDCLTWLTRIIPGDESVPNEAAIRLRASYLAQVAGKLGETGVTVPYLTYSAYSDYIAAMSTAAGGLTQTIMAYQTQIGLQRNAELTAKTAEEINANIKTTGKLITDFIGAMAANQRDIVANYDSIIATKQNELTKAVGAFASLSQAVADQTTAVSNAKLAFQQAMVKYETTEIIKAVINISTAFVTAGIAIATPASTISALKDLGETAQKIQKLVTVLSKIMDLSKTIEGTVKNIVNVNNTLDSLQSANLGMPTSLEWSEMSVNFDASLASTPSEVGQAKADFSAAFKILVLRAQAMLTAQAKIAQVNAEIALNRTQRAINEQQQARLAKLTAALNLGDTTKAPDLSEVDLIGLTGQVQSQLNQVLAALAQAMTIQDSAVQYELLAAPTMLSRFDLNSLQIAMANQQLGIINAKTAFNPPPFKVNDPIAVHVRGVPVSAFTGGNVFQFLIQPSETEFQPYNMVRVQQVVVDIPAITGSTGGHYRIDLSCTGDPFEDRDAAGEPLEFNTVARNFGPFEYKVVDGAHVPVFGDQTGSIADDITKITPFSTWQVKMPNLPVNTGVAFGPDATVDIVLTFRIEALAQPAVWAAMQARGLAGNRWDHADFMHALRPQRAANAMLGANDTPDTSKAAMLDQMFKAQGVLKGWDCVLNMLEEPVNRFLAAQYQEKYPTGTPMVVTSGFCESFDTVLAYTKFSFTLGPPLLQFQTNNHDYVAVTQVIQSGYIQKGLVTVPDGGAVCPVPLNLNDPAIAWGKQKPIDVSSAPTVQGAVSLGMVQGLVQPPLPDGGTGDPKDSHSVILDFSKGSFVAKNLNVDTDDASMNLQISNWFTTSEITYLINTVVFNDATTLKSLQPTSFKLNVLTTNSQKNILQVFIATSGQQQSNLTINVNEPIPDTFHNSLMINTKIMFSDIFVASFNAGKTDVRVGVIDPGNDYDTWKAKAVAGTVSGTAVFNNTSNSETRINASGNTITWPLAGLSFAPTKDQGVSLSYNVSQTVNFQHRDYTCTSSQYGTYCSWSGWGDHSVDVTVALSGNYPLTVAQDDKGQMQVQISATPPNITVTPPDLRPTGPCECNDNDLKIQVGQILQTQVPAKLQASMAGIQFNAVSVFALYNLLFPTQDFIVMKEAYVPGDLVVLGTFNKYTA